MRAVTTAVSTDRYSGVSARALIRAANDGVSLSNEPILLFLHGVGTGDQDDAWLARLTESLLGLGYPALDPARVIAPKYAHALKGADDKDSLPGLTIKQPLRESARQNRREFERRLGAVEFRLGLHDGGTARMADDAIVNAAVGLPGFVQARNYMRNTRIRAQVLKRILRTLPESGQLIIVGHSLGSVVAADLVRRLPVGLTVAGMVTIGSPLANGNFNVDELRDVLKEPPINLAWWVNFWNEHDPVAAHRGVSSAFPWMIDFRVRTKPSIHVHDAVEYLADTSVAAAIGFGLFGSRSKELAGIDQGLDIPVDAAERLILLALRYAFLIKMRLDGDTQDRFAGALRQVQATAVDGVRRRNDREKRAMPFTVARLGFDLSDPKAHVPEPLPSSHLAKDDAVVLLMVLATENVIRPFEISVPRDTRQKAMEELAAEMGLGSRFGTDVFTAAKQAQDVLTGSGVNWVKWGAMGAGAAAIVAATGGLALAAGAGLAGAAVITSALAAFGPGGMIGGLLTAGTLVTAGGGGIAFGLASPGTSAGTLEAVVARQLAAAILRKKQDVDQDPIVWKNLVETEIEVRRSHERLDEFSDDSSATLKELKRKLDAIERALKYMRDNGLEPGVNIEGDDEAA
jgi:pimeloyl-ACP methyl ester carboxylesterase